LRFGGRRFVGFRFAGLGFFIGLDVPKYFFIGSK